MNRSEYRRLDATALAAAIREGAVSAEEVQALAETALLDGQSAYNFLAEHYPDPDPGAEGPFRGVPMLFKDAGAHQARRAQQAGSTLLAGHVTDSETGVARRLRAAGLVALGRGRSSELTYHTSTESTAFGPVRNPWNPGHSAGGSSGGCAAAVAAGAVPIAHATDGGGSIRIPAAWCGLVGLKPGRGRVSWGPDLDEALFGMAAEHVLTRSVRDSAAMLDLLAGNEPGDPFAVAPAEGSFAAALDQPPARLRIGLVVDPWLPDCPVDPALLDAAHTVAALFADQGHAVEPLRITLASEAWLDAIAATWCSQLAAWVAAASAATGRRPEDHLEPATLACFRHGVKLSAVDLNFALLALNGVRRSVAAQIAPYDLVITPATATTAPPLGLYSPAQPVDDALAWTARMFRPAPFTALFNTTGQPAIALPTGLSAARLPIAVQLVARLGEEALLLQAARVVEQAFPFACTPLEA
ncbi:amidase family protein [Erythrobacter sp. T5W1-R]|uniref:amidase n=1 Tax=Erythrobacter sp. T5W1-R TaxID=3101752 RepID=UPI002AFED757|nr:amidase family protein [Erythrobacter sp. T5W1-R]MEA1617441.1 amidase family protein [Erythrobacter sp. T5W1-R]